MTPENSPGPEAQSADKLRTVLDYVPCDVCLTVQAPEPQDHFCSICSRLNRTIVERVVVEGEEPDAAVAAREEDVEAELEAEPEPEPDTEEDDGSVIDAEEEEAEWAAERERLEAEDEAADEPEPEPVIEERAVIITEVEPEPEPDEEEQAIEALAAATMAAAEAEEPEEAEADEPGPPPFTLVSPSTGRATGAWVVMGGAVAEPDPGSPWAAPPGEAAWPEEDEPTEEPGDVPAWAAAPPDEETEPDAEAVADWPELEEPEEAEEEEPWPDEADDELEVPELDDDAWADDEDELDEFLEAASEPDEGSEADDLPELGSLHDLDEADDEPEGVLDEDDLDLAWIEADEAEDEALAAQTEPAPDETDDPFAIPDPVTEDDELDFEAVDFETVDEPADEVAAEADWVPEDEPLAAEDDVDFEEVEFEAFEPEAEPEPEPELDEAGDDAVGAMAAEVPEAETIPPADADDDPSAYRHGEYTLYAKAVETPTGPRTIHFFARRRPEDAEPATLPPDHVVLVNDETGLPYLQRSDEGPDARADNLPGVSDVYRDNLAEAGIDTVQDMAGANVTALADSTDIALDLLEAWRDLARLVVEAGVPPQIASELAEVGVPDTSALAEADAATVVADLRRRGVDVSRDDVDGWIGAAGGA